MEHHAYSENINQSIGHIIAVYLGHTVNILNLILSLSQLNF